MSHVFSGEQAEESRIMRAVLRHASDRIIVVDDALNVQFASDAAQALFGPCMNKDGVRSALMDYISIGVESDSRLLNHFQSLDPASDFHKTEIDNVPVVSVHREYSLVNFSIVSERTGSGYTHILYVSALDSPTAQLKSQMFEVFEHSSEAILIFSDAGSITYFNRHAETLSGFDRSDMISKPASRFIPAAKLREIFTQLSVSGSQRTALSTFDLETASGSRLSVEALVRKIPVQQNSIYFAIVRGNSDALKFQKKILKEKQIAVDANSAKTNFLANMSHEMRTPLNGVLGTLSLIDKSAIDRETGKLISAAQNSAETLLALIDDLLNLHRIEAGEVDVESTEFKIADLVSIAEEVFTAIAAAKGIGFNVSSATSDRYCFADFGKIRQILINLIGNAMKFTTRGLVQVDINHQTRAGFQNVIIKVQDTGIGISLQDQKTLFERFKQVDSSTTKIHGGAGLGLAISRELTEIMGGDISVVSAPGVGSTFTFKVPVEERSAPNAPSISNVGGHSKLSGKVLIAEDSDTNAMVAQMMLKKLGVHYDRVTDGAAAIDAALSASYDIVLMDISMPNMDGIEATRILRQRGFNGPIIAMTAHAFKADRDRGFEVGMSGYITKPIKPAALMSELANWLPSVSDTS